MEYSKIVAVTGLPGLYELINSKTDGAIVRSLEDKSTRFISGRIHNFSQLESIEVFTKADNINLADVFIAMQKGNTSLPNEKDPVAVKKYFETIMPDLDFERVYSSDLKKMVRWFDILIKNNIEIKLSESEAPLIEPEAEPAVDTKEEKLTASKDKKAAKKTEKKATASKKK
ncbi:MAG: DUF5606 domain-containing protein [Bacteroidetes bacterium]|nr:DUF5606 domain-containing protein [Bacteroidota bacterium]